MSVLRSALSWLTTPLLPEHYLGLVDPVRLGPGLRGRVEAVRRETADATTLLIRPGRGWRGHLPGQHVPLGVDVDGVRTWRTYSITSPPAAALLAVTVKALPGGRASAVLARETRPGAILQLGPPAGEFVLPAQPAKLLFVAAGSGITPVAGMLRALEAGAGAGDVVLVHCARDAAHAIFGTQLRDLAGRTPGFRLHEWHTRDAASPGGRPRRLEPGDVMRLCPDWRDRAAYACGPEGLLAALEAAWAAAGRPDGLRMERFRLARPIAVGAAGTAGHVRFARSGLAAATDGRTPLLELGESLGLPMPSGCRQGICHSCLVVLRDGRVRDLRDGREHGEPGDLVQTCISVPSGPIELDC